MEMEKRFSVLDCVLSSLDAADRKMFLHRLMYIINQEEVNVVADIQETLRESVRTGTDAFFDGILKGFGLFCNDYVINVIEGTEGALSKHILFIAEKLSAKNIKILLYHPHILKTYFVAGWEGISIEPPSSLQSSDAHSDVIAAKHCIEKLLKLAEQLSLKADLRETVEESSQNIPEASLIQQLTSSPLLLTCEEFLNRQELGSHEIYHQKTWPAPPH